ncbi:hypothetical protein GQ44DRAFT_732657 [Phaeosphaeriaceae sp. PMI808]|nr:hypothetical protein GQ44DRAFT_732657 [Phaeosphaeriaceae sp. PMI808]
MLPSQRIPISAFGTFGATPAFGTPQTISKAETHSEKLMRSIAQLFNNKKYSDATICIHNTKLPVHKSVICTQIEYFDKAFEGGFVEGSSKTITFGQGSGAAYWRVFEYLYTGDYLDDLSTNSFEGKLATLLKDPRVYMLSDMFLLADLKILSTNKLKEKLKEFWKSDSFPECVREIYASTSDSDRQMRSAVVEVAAAHARVLSETDNFKVLLREGGDFTADYIDALTKRIPIR